MSLPFPFSPAEMACREIARDSAEPRLEPCRILEGGDLSPRRDEGLLGQILALRKIPAGAVSEGTDEVLVPLHDMAVGLSVSARRQGYELKVGSFFHGMSP